MAEEVFTLPKRQMKLKRIKYKKKKEKIVNLASKSQ
jgi:hypothetical protein